MSRHQVRIGRSVLRPILAIALVATACDARSDRGEPVETTTVAAQVPAELLRIGSDSLEVKIETVASGLQVPWDIDFVPDGRILLTERNGRIRVIENGSLRSAPWAELEVYSEDPGIGPESGLMGIALSPDFRATGHVYVMATVRRRSSALPARLYDRVMGGIRRLRSLPARSPFENRIYRFTDRGGTGVESHIVLGGLPANFYHAGGALRFGPDETLHATVGEVLTSPLAQNPASLVGAILRLGKDGSVPQNNPIAGSPVFAYGFRNSQGLAWHPETRELFAIDHGPTFLPHEGGRFGHDELNLIVPGGNYGWPVEAGRQADSKFQQPILDWTEGIAPGGLTFYNGTLFPWAGNALVGALRGQHLRRVILERATELPGWRVEREERLLERRFGRIRAVRVGPDGALYLTTSNRDGRGQPAATDDRLLRITPVTPAGAPPRNF